MRTRTRAHARANTGWLLAMLALGFGVLVSLLPLPALAASAVTVQVAEAAWTGATAWEAAGSENPDDAIIDAHRSVGEPVREARSNRSRQAFAGVSVPRVFRDGRDEMPLSTYRGVVLSPPPPTRARARLMVFLN